MLKLLSKIHLYFLVCFLILNTNLSANPKVDVKTAILVDYDSDEILYELDINYKSFIHLCILLGNDYNTRVKGYTVEQLYNLIKSHRTIDNLISKNILTLNFDYQSISSLLSF